jgi:pectate lyase
MVGGNGNRGDYMYLREITIEEFINYLERNIECKYIYSDSKIERINLDKDGENYCIHTDNTNVIRIPTHLIEK